MSDPRGFPPAEYRERLAKAQAAMAEAGLSALLLTTEADLRYFSGFLTRFWESPTRPWFLIVPAAGNPVAVIPAIGAPLMACKRTWKQYGQAGTWVSEWLPIATPRRSSSLSSSGVRCEYVALDLGAEARNSSSARRRTASTCSAYSMR